jgi:hypothetical protein
MKEDFAVHCTVTPPKPQLTTAEPLQPGPEPSGGRSEFFGSFLAYRLCV